MHPEQMKKEYALNSDKMPKAVYRLQKAISSAQKRTIYRMLDYLKF